VIVLALACRLVSGRLRLPAIVLLLPVGFAAGGATDDVHPDALLGSAYQPLVSLVGASGAAALWLLLGGFQRAAPGQGVAATLMVVVGAFMAWLAPRGIVAAAAASAFALQLGQAGVEGADDILPICFIAIFATVVLYGLTAAPLARRLTSGEPTIVTAGLSPDESGGDTVIGLTERTS
jgi:NhaP-type Na+/H+ or K+/H+ antiporter